MADSEVLLFKKKSHISHNSYIDYLFILIIYFYIVYIVNYVYQFIFFMFLDSVYRHFIENFFLPVFIKEIDP